MQAAPETALRAKASKVYARQSRETLEQRWILDHLPLVRHVVSKVTGSLSYGGDVEDLISAGTLGLVKAARAFDSTRHSEFKTYAYIRIRGAILDELRGRSFVPPSVHGQLRSIRRTYEALAAENGSPPSDEDLAARAGMSLRELYRTLSEARKQSFMSIHGLDDDHPVLGSFLPPDGAEAPDTQAERRELLDSLTAAIRQLPRRDRLVLLLYYERDLTMKETARVLGITESRVSQIHASALFKLSMKLRNAI
jgi:RNA polymerase sigma factor for flagellar operon FliA